MDYLVWVRELGLPVATVIVILWTGYRGYWVWGRELYDAKERMRRAHQQADAWRNVALAGTEIAKSAARFLESNGGGKG